jgi:hypothetical protein
MSFDEVFFLMGGLENRTNRTSAVSSGLSLSDLCSELIIGTYFRCRRETCINRPSFGCALAEMSAVTIPTMGSI